MKHGVWIGFVVAMLMTACSSFPSASGHLANTDPTLASIDSLLWTQPDSAFAQLQSFAENREVDGLDTFNRHYFHLLLSELLYKNDYAQTNRNELLLAVDYYDSLMVAGGNRVYPNLAFLDARAHYIDGAGYYEMDSAVSACEQYLNALEVMEDFFCEKELVGKKAQFMALSYTRLTDLFSDQYLHEQAIESGKNAVLYYKKYDAIPRNLSWMLDEIGTHFDIVGMPDSANVYYREALNILSDTNNLTYRDIATHLAYHCYYYNKTFDAPLSQLHDLLDESNDSIEKASRCLAIGDIFFHEKMYDSAFSYLEYVFVNTSDEEMRMQAAQWLFSMHKEEGDTVSVKEYEKYMASFANTGDQMGFLNSNLTQQFHNHIANHREKYLKNVFKDTKHFLLSILGILLAIGVLLFVFLYYFNKRKQKKVQKYFSEALSREKELKEENEVLRKTRHDNKQKPKYSIKDYEELLREEICINLKQRFNGMDILTTNKVSYYSNLSINSKQKRQLFDAFECHCPRFATTLLSKYPSMNNLDIECCMFYLIGISEKELGVLLQQNRSTIYRRVIRLKTIMEVEEIGPELKKNLFG